MSSHCAISFVIPVYNGQDTILRCINSIYSIDWGNCRFEVIVIDDCSTDSTIQILEDQSNIHNNLTFIRLLANGKPGTARNRGFELAQGEYIMFVDSDDTVEEGVRRALLYAIESAVDILFCRIREQVGLYGPFSVRKYQLPEHVAQTGQAFCEHYYKQDIAGAFPHFLFKRSFIKDTAYKFAEGVVFEDLDWTEYHLFKATCIEYDSSIIYSYYATPSSIIHTNSISQDADKLLFCYRRLLFAESIMNEAPAFAARVFSIKIWIQQIFSCRNMTKHTMSSVKALFDRVGPDVLHFFSHYTFSCFPSICINHPRRAIVLLFFLAPLLTIIRKIKHFAFSTFSLGRT